uniref:MYND-type domain-containing protein n=1 Tax=Panagrellus redivivus TaxID=6233 RepID=A0A7E4VXS3_PANRE
MGTPLRRIYMGFAQKLETKQGIASIQRQYLPLGKVGGKPAWLNPEIPVTVTQAACPVCKLPMSFVCQLYSSAAPEHAFHRYLYVFVCQNKDCQAHNSGRNFKVFRCQLPRENKFFLSDRRLSYDVDGDVPDPCFNAETFAKLCNVCGINAKKLCAKCNSTWYCDRSHQAIDWHEGHKLNCGKPELVDKDFKSKALLLEYGMTMEDDEVSDSESDADDDDDDDDSEEEEGDDVDELTKKVKNLLNKYDDKNAINELNELEESERDTLFRRFRRTLGYNPQQIIRYDRGGKPLLATDHSIKPTEVPNCHCGAVRQFEFQLTPYLISVLNFDSIGLDFATVLVYTCSDFCKIENDGYAEEYVFKQDYKEVDADAATLGSKVEE